MKSVRSSSTCELRVWVSSSVRAVAAPGFVRGGLRLSCLVQYLHLTVQHSASECMPVALSIIFQNSERKVLFFKTDLLMEFSLFHDKKNYKKMTRNCSMKFTVDY